MKKTFLIESLLLITTILAYSFAPVAVASQPTIKKVIVDEIVASSYASLKLIEKGADLAKTTNIGVLDFGDVKLGEVKPDSKISITNSGDERLIILDISISGTESNAFTITSPSLPVTIEPNSKIDISVKFKPTKLGLNQALMTITTNSENNTTVNLRGNGVENRTITSTVSSLSFGSVVINEEVEMKFEIENPTTENINIEKIMTSSSDFSVTVLTDPILTPNTKREIVVRFLPTEEKDYNEVLTITTEISNTWNKPQTKSTDIQTIEIPLTAKAIKSSVWNGIPIITSAKSYPNPSEGSISLELNFDEAQKYKVSIVDMKGIEQIAFDEYSTIGKNVIVWNGRDNTNTKAAKGTYFAIIKVGDDIQTIRFVIQ